MRGTVILFIVDAHRKINLYTRSEKQFTRKLRLPVNTIKYVRIIACKKLPPTSWSAVTKWESPKLGLQKPTA